MSDNQKSVVLQELEALEKFLMEESEPEVQKAAYYIFERIKLNVEKIEGTNEEHLALRFQAIFERIKIYLTIVEPAVSSDNKMTNENQVKVDLCCGASKPKGFIGVDLFGGRGVDIVADLNGRFPFDDNSVDVVRAHDAIEHLPDRIHTMNEIWRICKPNALVDIFVPSTDGRGAFQDPTHVSFWNINSFVYYSVNHPNYYGLCKRYGFLGGFKIEAICNVSGFDNIVHVQAALRAVK